MVMTPGTVELALVGTTGALDGHERLLAAFHDDDNVLVLVETQRPSNGPLLDADVLYLHDAAGVHRHRVIGRRRLTQSERRQFDAATPAELGTDLEVLRLGRAESNLGLTDD